MKRLPTVRDLILTTDHGTVFAAAVDSCGAIGMLPNDALAAKEEVVGLYTARVPLLEVLAVGASPVCATVSVSNGPETAEGLLEGVRRALGVTVLGACEAGSLRVGGVRPGDILYCAGRPRVGGELLRPGTELLAPRHIAALLEDLHVRAALPVGSRGVAAEARVLAEESGLRVRLSDSAGIELAKSAGPSACAVFAARPGADLSGLSIPVRAVGEFCRDA